MHLVTVFIVVVIVVILLVGLLLPVHVRTIIVELVEMSQPN